MNTYAFQRSFLIVLLLFVSHVFWGQNININQSASNAAEVEFKIDGITDTNLVNGTDFRIYWQFGDGHFADYRIYIADSLDNNTVISYTHKFERPGNFEDVFLEVARLYSEDHPPKRFHFSRPSSPVVINCTLPCEHQSIPRPPSDSTLKLQTNRNIVPGDSITFIITYDSIPCGSSELNRLTFSFTPNALEIATVIPDPITPITNSSPIKWSIPKDDKPADRVFISAKISDQLNEGDFLDFFAHLELYKSLTDICETRDASIEKVKAVRSHDPNDLDSPSNYLSCDTEDELVEYTVRFQNIGNGPATRIEIRDIIPTGVFLLNDTSINIIHPVSDIISLDYTIVNDHEVRWVIEGDLLKGPDDLRGTGESGFGSSIFESETIDSLVFTIPFRPDFDPNQCDAVINRAEIIFDCNPSIFTNPHILRFGCLDTINFPVDTCFFCGDSVILDYTPLTHNGVDTLSYNDLIGVLPVPPSISAVPSQSYYRWYPPAGITSSNTIPNPEFLPTRSTDYYRIRTYDCGKEITKIPIIVECELHLDHEIDCNPLNGEITVTVTASGSSNPSNLVWADEGGCIINPDTTYTKIFKTPSSDEFVITVTDRANNCNETLRIKLGCRPIGPIEIALATLLALGLIGFLLFGRQSPG